MPEIHRPFYTSTADETACGIEEAVKRYLEASANADRQRQRWENYSGNNPNKFRGAIKEADMWVGRWAYTLKYVYKVPAFEAVKLYGPGASKPEA